MCPRFTIELEKNQLAAETWDAKRGDLMMLREEISQETYYLCWCPPPF